MGKCVWRKQRPLRGRKANGCDERSDSVKDREGDAGKGTPQGVRGYERGARLSVRHDDVEKAHSRLEGEQHAEVEPSGLPFGTLVVELGSAPRLLEERAQRDVIDARVVACTRHT